MLFMSAFEGFDVVYILFYFDCCETIMYPLQRCFFITSFLF